LSWVCFMGVSLFERARFSSPRLYDNFVTTLYLAFKAGKRVRHGCCETVMTAR
jgi:hypothetical protein